MNKTLALSAIITAVILLSGTLGFSLSNPDVFASGQGEGKDEGKGKADHGQKGCETATKASEGKTKNPHCETEPTCEENCDTTCQAKFDDCKNSGASDEKCEDARQICLKICNISCDEPPTTGQSLTCQCNEPARLNPICSVDCSATGGQVCAGLCEKFGGSSGFTCDLKACTP